MSLFEFSDISKSEETIQRTWADFRSALATGVFSYNELDAAKANTTFLKVFDDLFSHCHPFLMYQQKAMHVLRLQKDVYEIRINYWIFQDVRLPGTSQVPSYDSENSLVPLSVFHWLSV